MADLDLETLVAEISNCLETSDFKSAVEKLNTGLESEPEHPRLLYMKAGALVELGDHEQAIQCYEESASHAGEMAANPLYNLANLHTELGDFPNALRTYQRVIEFDPTVADAWINMGCILDDNGEHQAALDCYDAANLVDDEDPMTWSNRGNSLRGLGQFEAAEDSYKKALGLDDADFAATLGLGVCMVKRGDASGLPLLEKAYGETQQPIALFELATALCKLDRYEDAAECYDLLITKEIEEEPAIWNNRGECLAKVERVDDALASFDKAISINADFEFAYFGKARVLANLERKEEARQVIEAMKKIASPEFLAQDSVTALILIAEN